MKTPFEAVLNRETMFGDRLPPIVADADKRQIAKVECVDPIYDAEDEIDEAAMTARDNAHAVLFAAAPDLLAACRLAENVLAENVTLSDSTKANLRQRLLDEIAKATKV